MTTGENFWRWINHAAIGIEGNTMEDRIEVTGIDKYKLLAALCNNTRVLGMGAMDPKATSLITTNDVYDVVKLELDDGLAMSFDYLFGRPLKIRLVVEEGKMFLDWCRLYDRDAGKGTAMRVVETLRQMSVEVFNRTDVQETETESKRNEENPESWVHKPLSASERANPLFSMGGGRSEADYQAFIKRYESTVCEALDECAKRDMVIAELKRKYEPKARQRQG